MILDRNKSYPQNKQGFLFCFQLFTRSASRFCRSACPVLVPVPGLAYRNCVVFIPILNVLATSIFDCLSVITILTAPTLKFAS